MNLRTRFCLFLLLSCLSAIHAQPIIALYPDKAPGSENWTWEEKESTQNAFRTRIVYNVVKPTLTVFAPDAAKANGTSVIICPGGAFHTLSIDNEGIDVAKWLNAKGITCFVLKYRLVRSLTQDPVEELLPKLNGDIKKLDEENAPVVPLAIADGKKAIEYVRTNARKWNLHPNRIGLMGFSAGGTVTAGVAFSYVAANRPDFIAPIYAYTGALPKSDVPKDAPPLFVAAASDDQLGFASHSTTLYNEWMAAGKSAEIHMYTKGGHGFGMRTQHLPVDSWIERFADWLDFQGLLKPATALPDSK